MSRSNYDEDYGYDEPGNKLAMYRQAVRRSLGGRRGQAFLREMLEALDALPERRLCVGALVDESGDCCPLGAVGLLRGLEMFWIDEDCPAVVAKTFGIATSMAAEIAYENDECFYGQTEEERFTRMRSWVEKQLEKVGGECEMVLD